MNRLPASMIKKTIIYLCNLSYAPVERVAEMRSAGDRVRAEMGVENWPLAVSQASRLMVAFQQASRDPEPDLIEGLARAALNADLSPEACRAFLEQIEAISALPGRAKEINRLHRKRGCRLCETPCRYGYFSLISDPNFEVLQRALETENRQSADQQRSIHTVWHYTLNHLSQAMGPGKWHISASHLGNLAYCLVTLATAKSRYPFPEEQMHKFQEMNQQLINKYTR
jgi:hypothetical protein